MRWSARLPAAVSFPSRSRERCFSTEEKPVSSKRSCRTVPPSPGSSRDPRSAFSAFQLPGEDGTQPGRRGHLRALGGPGPRGHAAPRLCGEQRLVGAPGGGPHEGPHGRGAGSSWNREIVEAGGRLRQEDAGQGHALRRDGARLRQDRGRRPRHRQHGGLRVRGHYPDKVERLVVMDAPIPGIGPWAEILQMPGVWHFNFHGADAERLVAGRERIYLDRIWNDFTGNPPSRTTPPGTSSRRPTRSRAGCGRGSLSSPRSPKTPRTTESSSRQS